MSRILLFSRFSKKTLSMFFLLQNEKTDHSFEIFDKYIIRIPDMLKIRPYMKKVKKIEKFAFPPENSIS